MRRRSASEVRPLPLWLALPLYIAWAAVSFGDGAAERLGDRGQQVVRGLLGATLATHVAEAALISGRVRRRGHPDQAHSWARSTLLWGFPNHLRVRKLADVSGGHR
ncbi:hypothetical protein GOARA_044_00120 [Gordonia araii NBRC 100433]|uniref:Uncharacterized protein n=1 Tax=Gordonia araii NBRC 100433 TaxID=1073574 RepID=G7H1B4_9ACTN|nr:DUF4499 domain-containing protein [Gordonia araii]NNG97601.1 DUF4499 domain-containing protein [Gordonia araii NBRC 100433]GAB09639.1 hypothetical protein GOARA_044_00120 [Gordonia araii NBRC 100433]